MEKQEELQMKTDGWNTFMKTGRVDDYLSYKSADDTGSYRNRNSDNPMGKGEREDNYGREGYSYRNGVVGNARW